MTAEVEYYIPEGMADLGKWQLDMAKQIEANRGFPISDIERELRRGGTTLIVRVETTLPSQAIENMLSDIEDHLPATATHVETREV